MHPGSCCSLFNLKVLRRHCRDALASSIDPAGAGASEAYTAPGLQRTERGLMCIPPVGTLTEGCACGKLAWLREAAGSKADELSNMPDFNRKELAINAERCLRMAHRLWRLIQQHARVLEPRKFYERSCAPRILLLSLQLESLVATLP